MSATEYITAVSSLLSILLLSRTTSNEVRKPTRTESCAASLGEEESTAVSEPPCKAHPAVREVTNHNMTVHHGKEVRRTTLQQLEHLRHDCIENVDGKKERPASARIEHRERVHKPLKERIARVCRKQSIARWKYRLL